MTQPRITTPYGMRTDANDIIKDVNLDGKRALITGAASGIGIETARALALAGADVTIAVRNVEAGQKVAADLAAATGNPNIHVMALDLSDLASVEALARAWQGPLHILINNAGVMASPLSRSPQGWESQFATNHMGHFALALALHYADELFLIRDGELFASGVPETVLSTENIMAVYGAKAGVERLEDGRLEFVPRYDE